MDQLNKMKAKVSKDCGQIANEIGDVRAATDEVARSKVRLGKGGFNRKPTQSLPGFR